MPRAPKNTSTAITLELTRNEYEDLLRALDLAAEDTREQEKQAIDDEDAACAERRTARFLALSEKLLALDRPKPRRKSQ